METLGDYGDLKLVDREEQEAWNYLPNRRIVRGEKLRLRGGPYVACDGVEYSLAERGVFTFLSRGITTINGKFFDEYLNLLSEEGGQIIVVLQTKTKFKTGLNVKRRPYKVAKVRG